MGVPLSGYPEVVALLHCMLALWCLELALVLLDLKPDCFLVAEDIRMDILAEVRVLGCDHHPFMRPVLEPLLNRPLQESL